MELHKVRTGENKFRSKPKSNRSDNPFRSFRNSRNDSYSRNDRYSRDDRRVESTTVTCADCGTECQVPFVPKTDRPVYCSDCFRQNKPQDSRNDRYSRDDRGSRYSRNDRGSRYSNDRDSRSSRDNFRSKKPKMDKFLKKQETFYSGGSEKFYNTLKEKLFEILGGKVCSSCGFNDERALAFSHNYDDTFDQIRRGGMASSWGKYISDPELARNELKILCLNCNETKESISLPKQKTKEFEKKKRFPR